MAVYHQKLREKSALYSRIDSTIRDLIADERRQHRKPRNMSAVPSRAEVQQFFWDYNTVEAVLLFCAVLVNLAGIMFESGRFESSYYDGQRDLITYVVMIVVIGSIVYFAVVFCAEAFGICQPKCCQKQPPKGAKKLRGGKRQPRNAKQALEMSDPRRKSIAIFQNNPMLTGANIEADDEHLQEFLRSDVLPPPGVWTAVRSKYQQLADTVAELNDNIRQLKRGQEGGGGGSGGGSSRRPKRRVGGARGNRTEFSQQAPARSGRARPGRKRRGRKTPTAQGDEVEGDDAV